MGPSSTGGIYRTILGIFRPKFASILPGRSIASTTKSFAKTGHRLLLVVLWTTRRSLGSLPRVLCATPYFFEYSFYYVVRTYSTYERNNKTIIIRRRRQNPPTLFFLFFIVRLYFYTSDEGKNETPCLWFWWEKKPSKTPVFFFLTFFKKVCSWYARGMLIKKSRDRIFQPHHTLSLFQTLSPNVHKCPKPQTVSSDEKMCQSSSAAHSRPFEISHSRKTVEFFHPKAAIIHAHSAKPILNQNKQT